eukprot:gene4609-14802_t
MRMRMGAGAGCVPTSQDLNELYPARFHARASTPPPPRQRHFAIHWPWVTPAVTSNGRSRTRSRVVFMKYMDPDMREAHVHADVFSFEAFRHVATHLFCPLLPYAAPTPSPWNGEWKKDQEISLSSSLIESLSAPSGVSLGRDER